MATLIAFDTVFGQCSVALMVDGVLIDVATVAGSRGQTEIILPMLDDMLNKHAIGMADIDAWAFNRGPGAFSGIRINTAVVQALSVANDAPCVGVSSLAVLADSAQQLHQYSRGTHIAAVMDARQNQVYLGRFMVDDAGTVIAADSSHESLLDYEKVVAADVLVGDGVDLVTSDAKHKLTLNPTAVDIARLAWQDFMANKAVAAEAALPVYLRDNAWKTLAEQAKK